MKSYEEMQELRDNLWDKIESHKDTFEAFLLAGNLKEYDRILAELIAEYNANYEEMKAYERKRMSGARSAYEMMKKAKKEN